MWRPSSETSVKQTVVPSPRRYFPSSGWLLAPTLTHCFSFRLSDETTRAGGGAGCETPLCLAGRSAAASLMRLHCILRRAVTEPRLKAFGRAHGHLELRPDWPAVIGVDHVGRCSFHPEDRVERTDGVQGKGGEEAPAAGVCGARITKPRRPRWEGARRRRGWKNLLSSREPKPRSDEAF